MISQALANGTNIEALERLFALRERSEKAESERSFNAAMTRFQCLCPAIIKDKETKSGNHYEYATLGQITMTIAKVQAECGLSHSFDSELKDDRQIVTCTVRHRDGFSRTATFTCPVDKAARMNVSQQGASALTFGRRYALLMAYGIGTADMDTDMNDADRGEPREPPITPNELKALLRRIVTHIPDGVDRRGYVSGLGVTSDPTLPESWTRAAYATAKAFCDKSEGGQ
jgi:hypothetical protein